MSYNYNIYENLGVMCVCVYVCLYHGAICFETHAHAHRHTPRYCGQASARATRSSCSVQDDETYFPHAVVEICAALAQDVHIRHVWHLGHLHHWITAA